MENCGILSGCLIVSSSANFSLKAVIGIERSFQKASSILSQVSIRDRSGIKIWRIKWPLFVLNRLRTVRGQTLVRRGA